MSFRSLFGYLRAPRKLQRSRRKAWRPHVECLEDRTLPSTIKWTETGFDTVYGPNAAAARAIVARAVNDWSRVIVDFNYQNVGQPCNPAGFCPAAEANTFYLGFTARDLGGTQRGDAFNITNYDPDTLSPEERARLIEETEEGHLTDVSFDIRPGHIGGEYPLKGDFRLRSFNRILHFLGRSVEEDPEYHVDKDPRTPAVLENPVNTMELLLSDGAPSEADLSIKSHGKYYAVNTKGPLARWNRDAFQLLYLLFQMTVTDVPRVGVPSITIAK